jgi:hypothetical protein
VPKSIDWVLKDIAYKAGVMYFSGSTASCSDDTQSIVYENAVGNQWALGKNDNSIITVDIEDADFGDEAIDYLYVILYAHDMPAFDDSTYTMSATLTRELTNSFINFAVQGIVFNTIPVDLTGGKRVTLIKTKNIFAIWLEDRFIGGYALRSTFGLETDGYISSLEDNSYLTVNASSSVGATFTVHKHELGNIANDIYAEQGSNALSAMGKVIRDARIKVIPNSTGGLKISKFTTHDDAGTIPDVVYTDAMGETDRIPTHVRITGEEISEYIDHAAAALYGLQFQSAQAEALDEEEAYLEAGRIVNDGISNSESRNQRAGAQLHHEVEDRVLVSVTKITGETVLKDCVVSAMEITYTPGALEVREYLRKYYEGS